MNPQRVLKTSLLAGVCALALNSADTAFAANQTWNPGGAGGGAGTWNATATNWDSGVAWTANSTAIFGGTAGTVTVSGTQNVGGLQFNTNGYTLAGGGLFVGNGIAIDVSAGTTTFSAASQVSLTGNSGVPIAMSKTGAGTLSLLGTIGSSLGGTGANAAAWTISGGTLEISGGNQLGANPGGSGSVMAILNGGTLRVLGNSVNTRLLQVSANGGTLEATQGVWAGNISNLADSGHTFNVAAAAVSTQTAVISGAISGAGSLTVVKVGSNNALQLTGANTYTGATTISGGSILSVGTIGDGGVSSSNLGSATSAASNLVFSNGTLQYTGATASSNRSFTITAGTTGTFDVTTNTLTLSGASASTTGALAKLGNGTLVLSGANNHSGTTTVGAGILSLANASALQNSALDTSASVTGNATSGLQATTTTLTLGGLTGNKSLSTVFTTTSGGYSNVTALTLNPQTGVTNSYSGAIANGAAAMALNKSGNGVQILSGTNTYSGATTVSAGTLLVNGSTSSNSTVTVNAGAILGGNGTVGGFTTVNGDLRPGNSPGVLTFGSGLTLNGTAAMEVNGATTPGTDYDRVVVLGGSTTFGGGLAFSFGNLLANSTTINLFSFTGTSLGNFSGVTSTGSYSGTWSVGVPNDTWTLASGGQVLTFSEVTGSLTVVPEPATWALAAFGLAAVAAFRRRRS